MLLLLYFLIFFFILLIVYQLFLFLLRNSIIREGAENNSGDLEQKVEDLSGNVTELQNQVNSITQAQQQYTDQMAPTEPTVTGQFD
jgi:peptidoglycan hydrolase CwlO-like protein